MKCKGLLLVLLTAFIATVLFCTTPSQAHAATVASGDCGDQGGNVTWTLSDNGTLTISGNGKMDDWNKSPTGSPWEEYDKKIKKVVVEDAVTYIGADSFFWYEKLTSVKIGSSVEKIGNRAFCETNIKTLAIPGSVRAIGKEAFEGCGKLTSVKIEGNSLISIGNAAFGDCFKLSAINIPDSVESIGDYAFCCCGLTGPIALVSVKTIGKEAFWSCIYLRSISFGDSLVSIGDAAFYECFSLKKIIIPNSVKKIGENAFLYCYSLASVKLGNSVKTLGGGAFFGCENLKKIDIPNSVTKMGNGVFYGCKKLKKASISDSQKAVSFRSFYGCKSLTSVKLGKSVNKIESEAFKGCDKLKTITVGKSVKKIGKNAFPQHQGFKLKVYKGSYALKYAKKNNICYLLVAKVKFNANKGKVSKKSKVVTVCKKYGSLPKPTREGYTFKGWYTQKKGGDRITSGTVVYKSKTHTLYARWEKKR